MPGWGVVTSDSLKLLPSLGGYALVFEALQHEAKPFPMPCSACDFVVTGSVAGPTSHTSTMGYYTIRVRINPLAEVIAAGLAGQSIQVSNGRGGSLTIAGILHWAWQKEDMYIFLQD